MELGLPKQKYRSVNTSPVVHDNSLQYTFSCNIMTY